MEFILTDVLIYYDGPQIALLTSPETGATYVGSAVYRPDFPSQEWPMTIVEISPFDRENLETDRTDLRSVFEAADMAWMCDLQTGSAVEVAVPLLDVYMVDSGLFIGEYMG